MIKEKILELADFIESGKFDFNFSIDEVRPACGSAGCIGGHAAALWPELRVARSNGKYTWDTDKLAEHLGISNLVADRLCFEPQSKAGYHFEYGEVTREMAVAAVRRLANTGEPHFEFSDRRR